MRSEDGGGGGAAGPGAVGGGGHHLRALPEGGPRPVKWLGCQASSVPLEVCKCISTALYIYTGTGTGTGVYILGSPVQLERC